MFSYRLFFHVAQILRISIFFRACIVFIHFSIFSFNIFERKYRFMTIRRRSCPFLRINFIKIFQKPLFFAFFVHELYNILNFAVERAANSVESGKTYSASLVVFKYRKICKRYAHLARKLGERHFSFRHHNVKIYSYHKASPPFHTVRSFSHLISVASSSTFLTTLRHIPRSKAAKATTKASLK